MQSQVAVYVNVSEQEGRIKLREKIQQQQHLQNNQQSNNQKNGGMKRYVAHTCFCTITAITSPIAITYSLTFQGSF